ncbi:MAG: hypothetical protein AB1757_07325 [Acidobacteriota bacterium]
MIKTNNQPQNLIEIEDATALDDLKLTDEKSDDIKGGHGVTVLAWARVDGVSPRS